MSPSFADPRPLHYKVGIQGERPPRVGYKVGIQTRRVNRGAFECLLYTACVPRR
jgi:hypothetical protein